MLFVLLPGAATATTASALTCGATITTSITFHANLNCSAIPGPGLIIGASGIVIKLNGFSIIGPGGAAGGYTGIANYGYSNVTVNGHNSVTGKNGKIRNFYYGYYSQNAQAEKVSKVVFVLDGSKNYYGLYTNAGSGNTYSYLTAKNAYLGFAVYSSAGDKFTHNTLTGNQYGAIEQSSLNDTWTANNFSYSTTYGYEDDAASTTLTGNTSSHNGGSGFLLNCNGGITVVVKYNTALYNGGDGVTSSYCSGSGGSSAFSTFTSNKTNHNVGAGISSTFDVNAKFSLNTANANTGNGFIFYYPHGSVITQNVSNSNISGGVYFATAGVYFPSLVSYNSSSSNGDYGFNADALVSGSHDTGTGNILGLFNNVSG